MTDMTRRRFLGSTAAAAAGLAAALSPHARAIEPFQRSGKPLLKLSLAAYSLRQFLTGDKPSLDIPGFIDYCASLGLDGAEPTSYFFPKTFDRAYLNDLKRRAHVAGLDISGGAIGNNFTLEGDALQKQIDHTITWIDHYAALGAPVIRVFAGAPPRGVSEEDAIKRCVPVFEQVCEQAGKRGVMLAIENHDFAMKIDRLMQIVKAVKSPWFGVNLDSGNFHSADPYADLMTIAPYSVNAQIKVEIQPAGKPKEPTDLKRVINILKDSGYRGYVVLEYEAAEDPYKAIPRYIDELRGLI